MPVQQYIINIRGPFNALDRVEQALNRCETSLKDRISSVTDITTIPHAERVVLLVEFAAGVKVKLVMAALDHKRAWELLSRIINVPRVLVADENWAAFEWIDGPTLRQHGLSASLLREAVRLLSDLHAIKIPDPSVASKVLGRVHRKLKKRLPLLVWNNIISETEHDAILDLSRSMSGETFDVSLIHGDFSPDNLVVRDGQLFSVDNDKVTAHASDYDLCRAVSLWDEWNSSGAALFETYCESARRSVAKEHLSFWGIFDLVYRISYRISQGEKNEFCINRLKQILATGAFR